jgi:hypothetical protein
VTMAFLTALLLCFTILVPVIMLVGISSMGGYWIGSSPSAAAMNMTGWSATASIYTALGIGAIIIPTITVAILLVGGLIWIVKNKLSI